jgi:hypothetical protein
MLTMVPSGQDTSHSMTMPLSSSASRLPAGRQYRHVILVRAPLYKVAAVFCTIQRACCGTSYATRPLKKHVVGD